MYNVAAKNTFYEYVVEGPEWEKAD